MIAFIIGRVDIQRMIPGDVRIHANRVVPETAAKIDFPVIDTVE
jgi:hypothetical protein